MAPKKSARSALLQTEETDFHWRPVAFWGRAAVAGLFLVLAITAVQCARLGAAGYFVQSAQRKVDQWASRSRNPGRFEIRDAAGRFSSALRYAPANPWALEGLGALELARMRVSANPREALAVTRTARVRIRQALQERPTSPFLWANLALTKLYLDEIDDELFTALRHADELGPWEPTVQETVLFVGLAVWRDLVPDLRQKLKGTIERGSVRNAGKMLDIVKSYARLELVCAIERYRLVAGNSCGAAAKVPGRNGR